MYWCTGVQATGGALRDTGQQQQLINHQSSFVSLQSSIFSLQYSVFSIQSSIFNLQSSHCSFQYSSFILHSSVFSLHSSLFAPHQSLSCLYDNIIFPLHTRLVTKYIFLILFRFLISSILQTNNPFNVKYTRDADTLVYYWITQSLLRGSFE